jgi:methyl-accepting chemotaxis protein
MAMFARLKVSTRLVLGFAVVLALLVAVGTLAWATMRGLAADIRLVSDERLPAMAQASDIIDETNVIAIALRNAVLAGDADGLRRAVARIERSRATIVERFEQLGQAADDDAQRAAIARALDARRQYVEAQNRALALVGEGRQQDAATYLIETADPRHVAYKTAVKALVDTQVELTQAAATGAGDRVRQAQTALLALVLVAVAAAAAVAILLVRALMRELGGEPRDAAEVARRIAAGDLTCRVTVRSGDAASLMAAMAQMQQGLSRTVTLVRSNADCVASASAQIAQGNADLSQRTEEQAAALEQTAASMEQLNSAALHNADNSRQASQLAQAAAAVATQGGEVVGEVVQAMRGIHDGSRRIAEIIGVIDGIAFQTNILALNAAVEAARAGESGRGFAVVAGEVRSLAQRAAAAAREIKALISASTEQVEAGSASAEKAGATMAQVVASIRRVNDLIGEISAATGQQSAGAAQVGEAVAQMDRTTQQNAALVEQSAAASQSLKQQAGQLLQAVAAFRVAEAAPAA